MAKFHLRREDTELPDGARLACYTAEPRQCTQRGFVYLPAMIGGSYLQQLIHCEALAEAGYLLYSFHYRGHRFSSGRFTLQSCCTDAQTLLARKREEYAGLPFFAAGTCFGAIPMLSVAARWPGMFERIVLVNGIVDFQHAVGSPLDLMLRHGLTTLLRSIRRPQLLAALLQREFFPELEQVDGRFGMLDLRNIDYLRTWQEYAGNRPYLHRNRFSTPALCLMGTTDAVLGFQSTARRARYKAKLRRAFAKLTFREYETGHLFQQFREQGTADIIRFLSGYGLGEASFAPRPMPAARSARPAPLSPGR